MLSDPSCLILWTSTCITGLSVPQSYHLNGWCCIPTDSAGRVGELGGQWAELNSEIWRGKKKKDQVPEFFPCPLSLGSCLIEHWAHVFLNIPFAAGVNKEAFLKYDCIAFWYYHKGSILGWYVYISIGRISRKGQETLVVHFVVTTAILPEKPSKTLQRKCLTSFYPPLLLLVNT